MCLNEQHVCTTLDVHNELPSLHFWAFKRENIYSNHKNKQKKICFKSCLNSTFHSVQLNFTGGKQSAVVLSPFANRIKKNNTFFSFFSTVQSVEDQLLDECKRAVRYQKCLQECTACGGEYAMMNTFSRRTRRLPLSVRGAEVILPQSMRSPLSFQIIALCFCNESVTSLEALYSAAAQGFACRVHNPCINMPHATARLECVVCGGAGGGGWGTGGSDTLVFLWVGSGA